MSSSYLLVICMLGLQLAGQVSCVVEFVCDVDGPFFCYKEHDMNQERYYEDVSQDPVNILYTLNVTDPDDPTATFKFEILITQPGNMVPDIANGIDFLAIDESTGDVTFHTPIDFEEFKEIRPTWLITSLPSGVTLERYVRVWVENVHDISPQFNYEPYVSDPIPENTIIGTTVFSNVNVTDGDDNDDQVHGPIVLSLLESLEDYDCDYSTFRIDSSSGDLILNENVTYLGKATYTVCIQADDQITNRESLKSSTTVRLSISDVQGEAPVFFGIPYRVSVPENTAVNTTIFNNIFAADGDTGVPNPNPVFITLLSGGYDRFRVSSEFANKAVLIINQALDREINDSYTLKIQARENDNSQPDENIATTTLIDVTILDVNDEAPEFSSLPDPVYLLENSPTNTPLNLGVTVTDADTAPNARFQLSLQGEGAAPFILLENKFTGVGIVDIRVYYRELLDYEVAERFDFMVVASEDGHDDVGFNVTVFLEDVNDNSPVFEEEIYNCEVFENSVGGTSICQLTATDLDRSPEYANITYQLEGSESDRFVIDLLEGNVTVATDVILDAETQDVFFLTVLANNGDRVSTTLLQINLKDLNDVKEPPPPFTALTQWIFFGFAVGCLLLLVIIIIAFVFTRNDYRRKLRAATAGMQSSKGEAVNKTVVPGTTLFSKEVSNPVFKEKPPIYEEKIEMESTEDVESAGGSKDQEVAVNIYDELDGESAMTPEGAANSGKLLLAVLEELEDTKHGYDNIDVMMSD